MTSELEKEIDRLKALLREAQETATEKEKRLSEIEGDYSQRFRDAEETAAARYDERERALRQECELEKLRALEALRKQVDTERERWYEERLKWDEWRKEAEGEKRELLLTIKGLSERGATTEKERSPSSRSSSSSEGESSEGVPPQEGVRESVADAASESSSTVTPSTGVESSVVTTVTGSARTSTTTAVSTPLTSTIPISSVAGPATGDGVIQSVARLLEAQTQVVAKAMVAHSFQPLTKFNGENDEEPFERWLETFDDRAKVVGWTTEQKLYQLKSHLHGTALQSFRLFDSADKSEYSRAVAAMKKRFALVDIEELRGTEFHSLNQDKQSVEQLGIDLQKLAHKAFPTLSGNDFDRLLKGRFYSALLPKWQKKLGAPKPSEKFSDLYERAHTVAKHDEQFKRSEASRSDRSESGPRIRRRQNQSSAAPSEEPLAKAVPSPNTGAPRQGRVFRVPQGWAFSEKLPGEETIRRGPG